VSPGAKYPPASAVNQCSGGHGFTIGIDPHKGTHTAAVLDGTETVVDELRLVTDRRQRDRLLSFATRFEPRTWAIEGAGGLGTLVAQQLVADLSPSSCQERMTVL
jgi:hypothetical protein